MEFFKIAKYIYRYVFDLLKLPYFLILIYRISNVRESANGYVVISPSLTLSGAPLLSKAIYDGIVLDDNKDCIFLSIYGGSMRLDGKTKPFSLHGCRLGFINELVIKVLVNKGYDKFICNSVVSATLASKISSNGGKAVSLIHEMANVIKSFGLDDIVQDVANNSKVTLFSSRATFKDFLNLLPEGVKFKYDFLKQGIYNHNILIRYSEKKIIKSDFRKKHGIPDDKKVVLGIGNDLQRKGFEYFLRLSEISHDNYFVWVGNNKELNSHVKGNFLNLPMVDIEHTYELFFMSDVFFLSSIEDPFPSVILEAMLSGLPVMSLIGSGGADEIVNFKNGLTFHRNTLNPAREFLDDLDEKKAAVFEEKNHDYISKNYKLDTYINSIIAYFEVK